MSARENRSYQASLRESEEHLRALVEGIGDYAIFMLDAGGHVTTWNEGARRINGYKDEEIIGEHFSVFYTEKDVARAHPEHELRVAASEGRYEEEGLRVRKGGSWFWASVLITALRDEQGDLMGFSKVVRDITERREAEQRLKESEELFRATFEQAAVGMAHVSLLSRWLKANDRLCRMLGYTESEMAGLGFQEVTHPEDLDSDLELFNRLLFGTLQTYSVAKRYLRKDGSLIWVNQTLSAVHEPSGRLGHFLCIVEDITERKRFETGLQRSLGSLLALYEAGQVLSSTLDQEQIVLKLLEVMQRISNISAACIDVRDEEGRRCTYHSVGQEKLWGRLNSVPEAQEARRAALESGRLRSFGLGPPEAGEAPLIGLCLPLRMQGRVVGLLEAYGSEELAEKENTETLASLANQGASALEKAWLHEKLAERERDLEDLVGKMLLAQEEERRRVAYEVHDGLTQVMVAVHQRLQLFAEDHPPASAEGREELEELTGLVRRAVGEARRVIANLRPTTLDDLGLATAVRLQIDELRAEGYEADYEETLGEERLPTNMETALFRIAQEALTNARKHARTDRMRVTLGRDAEGKIRLEVRDWGRGFEPTQARRGGGPGERVGLSSMRERITLLGGDLTIRSRPGDGTSVVAEIPPPAGGDGEGEIRDGT